ncbi:hypothetical protein F4820DRAFT_128312 [Hypoxylon rubiginosum]|uniref:Uncharacterized protein n=1 Tax=Hypoxylon rubiginosum TaxID=110542 RepID=A0ACB9YMN5_9PEZI|nr:hypothetical protein F4820DRAFT_128312 [Hypoxylon rubiginosum]
MADSDSLTPRPPVSPEFLPNGLRNDPPLPPNDPTIGFKLNHLMLRIRDPVRSLHFYINLMSMRTVFTANAGPFTIYYLGYPQTDVHRADPVAYGQDTLPELPHTFGLIELYHVHGSENEPEGYYSSGNDPPNLRFGHLGFTVPDVRCCTSTSQEPWCRGHQGVRRVES